MHNRETECREGYSCDSWCRQAQDGFYEGGDYKVTWTFGHLCTLKEPADYTDLWKRWSLGALPMIPQRFGIKLIADRGIEKQFNVIKKLIAEADEVINCGDAGQEGELIQRWVMQKAEIKWSGQASLDKLSY